jgi:uncharacterized glyoxalase superfamily protein PhnB
MSMSVPQRLSLVVIGAEDVAGLRAFYARWGWEEGEGSAEGHAAYCLGSTWLYLYPRALLAAETAADDTSLQSRWRGVVLSIGVAQHEDVDPTFAQACVEGATVIAPPADHAWGGRSGYVADPEGNCWEILWAPHSAWSSSLRSE